MSRIDPLIERIVSTADKLVPDRPFYPYQREFAWKIVEAVLNCSSEELTGLFSRQSGKTEVVTRVDASLMITLPFLAEGLPFLRQYKKGFWNAIFAPVKEQAGTAYARLVDVLETPASIALLEESGIVYTKKTASLRQLSNGSFTRIYSASPGANIESATLHKATVEEAQDVGHYKLRKSIEPMLASTAGLEVLIGTANEKLSPFYESIQRNKKIEHRNQGQKKHFEYDWKIVQEHNPFYAKWLNKKLEERGMLWLETDEFKMAFALVFMLARGMFCSYERFIQLEDLCQFIPRGPYNEKGVCTLLVPIYFGIDWGKSADSTVVTALAKYPTHNQVVDWLELVGDDYDNQYEAIVQFINRFPTGKLILPESNGVGDPMVDRLKGALRKGKIKCQVIGWWSSASNKSNGYRQLLQDFVVANRVLFPSNSEARASIEYDKFACQITELEKHYQGSLLKCNHPDKPDAHDDYTDSLMLAHLAASQPTSDGQYERFFYGDQQET